MISKGAIYAEQAYAQGKMLDHSEWFSILPRGITPSDIDMVLDNRGRMIFVELTTKYEMFEDLSTGQRILHEGLAKCGKHVSVLGWHDVPSSRQINTFSDISKVSLMFACDGKIATLNGFTNFDWQVLVKWWFNLEPDSGPDATLKSLRGEYRKQ
jgi:hypothetical protein